MLQWRWKIPHATTKTESSQIKKNFFKYILPSINIHCISKVTIAITLKTDCFVSNFTVLVTHIRKSGHQATLFLLFKSPIQRSWHIAHLWLWSSRATCKTFDDFLMCPVWLFSGIYSMKYFIVLIFLKLYSRQAKLLMNFILEWQKVLGQTWLRITPIAWKCTEGLWERRGTYNCVRSRVAHNSQRGSDPCPLTKVWINKMWCVCMYTYICNRKF